MAQHHMKCLTLVYDLLLMVSQHYNVQPIMDGGLVDGTIQACTS